MKSELSSSLEQQLAERGMDLLDIIPIPGGSNRSVRLRTLEDALETFDGPIGGGEAVGYLVKVRAKTKDTEQAVFPGIDSAIGEPDPLLAQMVADTFEHAKTAAASRPSMDGVYYPDGKLNIDFLKKNAELLEGAGEYHLASNIYRTMLANGEARAIAYNGLANCALKELKLEEAARCLDESLAYQPDAKVYENLGAVLNKLKRDQSAAETLERGLAMKSLTTEDIKRMKYIAADYWRAAGILPKAEKHYSELSEMDPHSEELQCSLGELASLRNAQEDAKKRFQMALAQNPRSARALHGLGMAHFSLGDKKTAHDLFARSLDQKINNAEAVFHLVKIAFEARTYVTAARILGEYIKHAPVNANLLYSLAGLQFHLGRFGEARSSATKSLEMQPNHSGSKELIQLIERYSGVKG